MLKFFFAGLALANMQMPQDEFDECDSDTSDCALNVLQLGASKKTQIAHSEQPTGVKTSAYMRPKNHLDVGTSQFVPNEKCPHPPCSGQVHIQLGAPGEMVVSFVSQPESDTASRVRYGRLGSLGDLDLETVGKAETYSQLMFWNAMLWDPPLKGGFGLDQAVVARDMSTDTWAYDPKTGWKYPSWREIGVQQVEGDKMGWYKNPSERYDSPKVHTVVLTGLKEGETYTYQVENDDRSFTFTYPMYKYPYHVGLVGDIGQTPVSNSSMHLLSGLKPDVVLLTGDLSYADGYYPRWDSFGIMFETLGSKVPVMTVPGNHEYGSAEAFKSYNVRYPMPYLSSGSSDPNYWSRDIGPMHVVGLNSYASAKAGSYQYRWLLQDLKSFDRKKTPWLVAMMHAPWYNSNLGHYGEAKVMMEHLEEIFFEHGVNLVLAGHVHSFERTWPAYRNETNACGPVYINIGDGGNREGPYAHWLPFDNETKAWSAFRQGAFGIGDLKIMNGTHAFFTWRRSACFDNGEVNFDATNCSSTGDNSRNSLKADDISWIVRGVGKCQNQ
mmetsp:Transcript_20967/g.34970  ORF Transcript_20967/g.34970 Transcript_20967/m.34970 type:complete len:553 (-) Transcript_20967:108-1766(-)